MDCVAVLTDVSIQYEFYVDNNRQKTWIDALLRYSGLCLIELAAILDVPAQVLHSAHKGSLFFDGEKANNLAIVFLTFFSGKSQGEKLKEGDGI